MTDHTGLLQHATFVTPNTEYGYCTDDNARALLFVTQALDQLPGERRLDPLFSVYFRFLQAAFETESGRFRNLRGYDGSWAEEPTPGDAPGRALWALGNVVGARANWPQRIAAKILFERALPAAEALTDLRPIACAILGLCGYLRREESAPVLRALEMLAGRLARHLEEEREPNWPWLEPSLSYENARVPQAMIAAGGVLLNDALVSQGLTTLRWLIEVQTHGGFFSPIGNEGWYKRGGEPSRFDQQPIEADSTIAACAEAFLADGDTEWLSKAQMSYDWFMGKNAIGRQLCVPETGGCRDGLSPSHPNENQGAESTLAWLTSQLNMQAMTASARQRPSQVGARQ